MKETVPETVLALTAPSLGPVPCNVYRIRPRAGHVLALTTGVPAAAIATTAIVRRQAPLYAPWYSAAGANSPSEGRGGAITLGYGHGQQALMVFTENWFEAAAGAGRRYKYAWGDAPLRWLDHLAHEVGHLPHIAQQRTLAGYLLRFGLQYARYGHDAAPLEQEAEAGRTRFRAFQAFVAANSAPGTLLTLLGDPAYSDEAAYDLLDAWHAAFCEHERDGRLERSAS